jgi:hypothetical protein
LRDCSLRRTHFRKLLYSGRSAQINKNLASAQQCQSIPRFEATPVGTRKNLSQFWQCRQGTRHRPKLIDVTLAQTAACSTSCTKSTLQNALASGTLRPERKNKQDAYNPKNRAALEECSRFASRRVFLPEAGRHRTAHS